MRNNKNTIILWGVSDTATILSARDYLLQYEEGAEIILVIRKSRADEFANKFSRVITTEDDIKPQDLSLLVKALFLNTGLHVIPCDKDYNLYYAVAPILRLIAFFKKRALIGLLKNKTLTRIPIQCQTQRTRLKYFVLIFALAFLVSKIIFWTLASIFIGAAGVLLFDYFFKLYLKHFRRADFLTHYMFKREEIPYVSHGWMHPFDESYFNRFIYSREGPANQFYEINEDYFPVYNPTVEKRALMDRFEFVNTHDCDLRNTGESLFILGGSVAQGLIGNPASYHSVLENKLKSSQPTLRAIPWAIGGYQSTQSRILAECSLFSRPLAGIISLDFYNDVLYTILGVPPGDTQRSQRKYLAKSMIEYKILDFFFDYLLIARFIWQRLYAQLMTRHMLSLINHPKQLRYTVNHCVDIYLENATRLHEQSKHRGTPYTVFVQPFREDIPYLSRTESQPPKAQLVKQFYVALRSRVLNNASLKKFIHFCPHNLLTKSDFADEVHLSESGQTKLADFMAQVLGALNLMPISSRADTMEPVHNDK